jgi:hypothetical protein
MKRRTFGRAGAAAMTALILTTIAASADTVPADGDALTPGSQTLINLGDVSPGQVVTWPVTFTLLCSGTSHAPADATIQLDLASVTVPGDGTASATSTTIGPVPADWTAQSQGCPSPTPSLLSNGPSVVTLTAPTTPGNGQQFILSWSHLGSTGVTGGSAMTFSMNVIGNTPPVLDLPAEVMAEATSPAGAAVSWTATATDAEDSTPPTPTCTPASGSTFALGMTTVHCSVTDGGGMTTTGSFLVAVEDTTAPDLHDMPADTSATTTDPAGTTLAYATPSATDLADPAPVVDCSPASGTAIPLGTTTVTCTATDATGNHASASFTVSVSLATAVTWTALWGEPVATNGSTFTANSGRNVPVKVSLFADGVEQTRGSAVMTVATCDGSVVNSTAMSWSGGRWNANLDTGTFGGPGCYMATASLDGNGAGSFRIDLRGPDPVKANGSTGKNRR